MSESTIVIPAGATAEVLPAAFDYAALDSETRIVVQQRTSEIRTIARRAASDVIEIGQKLIDVKERLGHGNFGNWLEAEFQWSESGAQRFMRVAERFQNRQIDGFAPSALYMLAAPSVPEAARDEAVQRAEAGERITVPAAKDMIARAQYAAVADLIPGVRAWLASVPAYRNNTTAQRDVLNQIKIQSPAGRGHLAQLMVFPGLATPNRASDIVAACRYAFDDINAEAQHRIAKVVITGPAPDAPDRAPIYEIERALQMWLKQLCATQGEERVILEDIKAKRDPWYDRVFGAPTLPPNRTNGDVLQAAHNLLDHMNQAAARDATAHAVAAGHATPDSSASGAITIQTTGKCQKCGRPLTDPAHVAAGCGPICAAKAAGNGGHAAPTIAAGRGELHSPEPPDLAAIVEAWLARKVEDNDLPDDRQSHIFVLTQIITNRTFGSAVEVWKDLRTFDQWPPNTSNDDKIAACRVILARLTGRPIDTIDDARPTPQPLRPIDLAIPPAERDQRRIRQLEHALAALIAFVESRPVAPDLEPETDAALQAASTALHDATWA